MDPLSYDLEENHLQKQLTKLPGDWLAETLRRMFEGFRDAGTFSNSTSFVVQMGVAVENFPMEVVEHVATTLPRERQYPPSIKEMVDACVRHLEHLTTVRRNSALGTVARTTLPGPQIRDRVGDGGPGTIYSNYFEAVAAHGVPRGNAAFGEK